MAPLYFKKAVDALATQTHVAAQAAVMALLWSGACRIVNGLAKELQHPIFTPVAQVQLKVANLLCPSVDLLHMQEHQCVLCVQLACAVLKPLYVFAKHQVCGLFEMLFAMQAAGRRVAYHTFSHVLDLDVGFHLERRTGALSRILERGNFCCAAPPAQHPMV